STTLRLKDVIHLSVAEAIGGESVPHTPLGLDKASGGLFFRGGIPVGANVQMTRVDPDRVHENSRQAVSAPRPRARGRKPSVVFQLECATGGRHLFGERVTENTIAPVQEILGPDLPWIGFYAYGEITQLSGRHYFQNCAGTLCVLYEPEDGSQ